WAPDILRPGSEGPSDRAFYIPHAKKVFASGPGDVEIIWKDPFGNDLVIEDAQGNPMTRVPYSISTRPAKAAVRLYWTDRYDEYGNLTSTGAPSVNVSDLHVVPHYNEWIPSRLSDEMTPPAPPEEGVPNYEELYAQYQRDLEVYQAAQTTRFLWQSGDTLRSQGRKGYIVLEVNADENTFIGVEIVELRPYAPDFRDGPRGVGSQLWPGSPGAPPPADAKAYVAKGLAGDSPYVYQHAVAGPDEGKVYAIRPTTNDLQIEVFWQRPSTLVSEETGFAYQILWPYEMHRYTAAWPAAPQWFIRGHAQDDLGRPVTIPEALHPELMVHQEPVDPARGAVLEGNVLDARGPGLFLLRYNMGTPAGSGGVLFQVVKSVVHDNTARHAGDAPYFDLTRRQAHIGVELTDAVHDPSWPEPGYVHVCAYQEDDPDAGETLNDRYAAGIYADSGQIIPVNVGLLEVWWTNRNPVPGADVDPDPAVVRPWQWPSVQWPSKVIRYGCDWPAAGSEDLRAPIVISSQLGTGPIAPSTHADWSIYVQNDAEEAGFNPNDEHALALDPVHGPVFALRDDLGSTETRETSRPYVLLQYRDPTDGARWCMDVHPVIRGDLSYFGTAGTLLQPPLPISMLPPYCSENAGVSGPFWEDRKGFHWAMGAGGKMAEPEDSGAATQVTYTQDNDQSLLTDPGKAWTPGHWAGGVLTVGGRFYHVLLSTGSGLTVAGDVTEGGTVTAEQGTPLSYRVSRDTAAIVMRHYYPVQEGFFFPGDLTAGYAHAVGDHVPWLDADTGVPADTTFTILWPEGVPELRVGETLVQAKFGLPEVSAQASVAIVHQQAQVAGEGPSAALMDPTRIRWLSVAALPDGVATDLDSSTGEYRFPELPPHLYERLSYDGSNHRLNLRGVLIEPPIGEYYLLPNVITG
ncbi:MAG: hypothetical protein JXR77_15040, partial [Lentisphaeria bacterium]|nr:hypothetical protein [Lentisphaeria bacterium]